MADQAHIKRERARARELRDSQWWKNRIGPGICHHCGKKFPKSQLTMDHLMPLARGGKTTKSNVVPSCKSCNQTRGHKLDAERALDELEIGKKSKSHAPNSIPTDSDSPDSFHADNGFSDVWLAKKLQLLLGSPLPGDNCFSISRRYFEESYAGPAMTADQVLDWVTARFMQISTEDILEYPEPVLLLVWSRSMAESVALNSLQDLASLIPGGPGGEKLCVPNVQRLAKRELGFPHGWVLEHSLVMIEPFRQGATRVFEKATPKDDSMPRVYSLQDAIAPYMGRSGLSLTLHLKLEVDDLA